MAYETDSEQSAQSSTSADGTGEFVLLSDLPVELQDKDLLGMGDVAESIAKVLCASAKESPFVFAVDADWGMGKSTLLKMVRAKLDPKHAERKSAQAKRRDAKGRRFTTVWFNAWTAEGDNALAGLIKSVLAELDSSTVRSALRSVARHKDLLGAAVIVLRIALSFFGFFSVSRLVDDLWTQFDLDGQSGNRLREDIAGMLQKWIGKSPDDAKRRMVVFVDDLDRCTDDVVVKVCEAMKLYLDVPGLIFVLACDQSVLSRSFQDPARGGSREARSYLEKIIQVQYRLPSPGEKAIEHLIDGYVEASNTQDLIKDEVRTTLEAGCGRNPRRIKRIINSFILEYRLSPAWRNWPLSSHHLLVAILIQHLYHSFYAFIKDHSDDSEDHSGDPITQFLTYAELREELEACKREQQEEVAPLLDGLKDALVDFDLYLHGTDDNDPDRLISLLDAKVPEVFVEFAENKHLVALLNSISEESRKSFLDQLRFLVTESAQPAPLEVRDTNPGTNRGRARSVEVIYQHQLIPDGASITLELENLVRPEVAQQVLDWMREEPDRPRVWWSPDPRSPLRWAVEPDRKWTPTALRNEIFRRAGIAVHSFSAADAWCYDGTSLYWIANSVFESS